MPPIAHQPAAIARVRDDAVPMRLNPLARVALNEAQYARAEGRYAKCDGLLTKYAAFSGQTIERSARELVQLNLMAPDDPRAIAASEHGRDLIWRNISQTMMVAEQKKLVEEMGRASLSKDAAKKVASLALMIRQNNLSPFYAASINEGLSSALVRQGSPELALKAARSGVRAGALYLHEHAQEQEKAAKSAAATQARRPTAAERAAEINR